MREDGLHTAAVAQLWSRWLGRNGSGLGSPTAERPGTISDQRNPVLRNHSITDEPRQSSRGHSVASATVYQHPVGDDRQLQEAPRWLCLRSMP